MILAEPQSAWLRVSGSTLIDRSRGSAAFGPQSLLAFLHGEEILSPAAVFLIARDRSTPLAAASESWLADSATPSANARADDRAERQPTSENQGMEFQAAGPVARQLLCVVISRVAWIEIDELPQDIFCLNRKVELNRENPKRNELRRSSGEGREACAR